MEMKFKYYVLILSIHRIFYSYFYSYFYIIIITDGHQTVFDNEKKKKKKT